jgi:membrane protein required for colicin V production
MTMTSADLLLLAVIGVSTLLGLMRGFIGVLASLLAWVLAG